MLLSRQRCLQAVIHCEIIRQAAQVVAMDNERLRSGDRAIVRFRFLQVTIDILVLVGHALGWAGRQLCFKFATWWLQFSTKAMVCLSCLSICCPGLGNLTDAHCCRGLNTLRVAADSSSERGAPEASASSPLRIEFPSRLGDLWLAPRTFFPGAVFGCRHLSWSNATFS